MVFNFRKIASVIASAVMVGSTIAIAAATQYPAPFVANGNADVALVYGSKGALTDLVAVNDITANLNSALARQTAISTGSSGSGITVTGGESVALVGPSLNLNIGSALDTVKATPVSSSDLPTLLADNTYTSHDGQNYDYTQQIKIGSNLNYTFFKDSSYNNDEPSLGIRIPSNTNVLNYTLSFKTAAKSSVDSDGRLADLQNTKITILGKEYTILNAYNSTTELDLMSGATSAIIAQDAEQDVSLGNQTYKIKVTYVDTTTAKFTINGGEEQEVSVGGTYTIPGTDTELGVKSTSYQGFAGGKLAATFTLGAEKLTLADGQTVEMNDNTIDGLTAHISRGMSGTKVTISNIVLQWQTSDLAFVAPDSSLTFPGLNSVKLLMGNMTMPDQEITKVVNNGNLGIRLSVPVKDGTYNLPILYGNGTLFNKIGDSNLDLTTTSGSSVTYNTTQDGYLVASWSSSNAAESYVLKFSSIPTDNSTVDVKNLVTGSTQKINNGQTVTFGSVGLTLSNANHYAQTLTVAGSSGVSFNKLFTKDGLEIYLPVDSNVSDTITGGINLTYSTTASQVATYPIRMKEEAKDGTIAGGKEINVTVGFNSNAQSSAVSAPKALWAGGQMQTLDSDSNIQIGYVQSELGTKVTYDSNPDQRTATIEYHGGETYGNAFLAAPSADVIGGGVTTSSGSTTVQTLGSPVVADTEVSSVAGKNLIVIGGSCVNTEAAKLLGSDTPICGDAFTTATTVGENQYLIKTFANGGKVATLVAGFNAQDTLNGAKFFSTQTVDTTVGNAYRGTTETSATPITDTPVTPVTPVVTTTGNDTTASA